MDSATIVKLVETLQTLSGQREMFTCWDVTRLLRADGFDVPHQEIREVIHGLDGLGCFQDALYERNSMVRLRHYNVDAEVYAPLGADVSQYDPDKLKPRSTTQQPQISWPNIGTQRVPAPEPEPAEPEPAVTWPNVRQPRVQSTVFTPDGPEQRTEVGPITFHTSREVASTQEPLRAVANADARGRFCIPKALVEDIGLVPGQVVYVARRNHNQPGLVILRRPPQTGQIGTYTVDDHCNVRISRRSLLEASVNSNSVRFRVTDNKQGIVAIAAWP